MTAQERIAMMNKTITAEAEESRSASLRLEEERRELIDQIMLLGDRISALINVGNSCAEAGQMPYRDVLRDVNTRTKENFCTDGIYHEVGFWRDCKNRLGNFCPTYSVKYVGFQNGGANGPYDFFTDGREVFEEHEDANKQNWDNLSYGKPRRREPTIEHLQKFLSNYEAFEQMFYSWFDKRFGSGV